MPINEEQLTGQLNSVEKQLLYAIREALRETNTLLRKALEAQEREEKTSPVIAAPEPKKKKILTCKQCGKKFDNAGQFMSHSKKHKKEV